MTALNTTSGISTTSRTLQQLREAHARCAKLLRNRIVDGAIVKPNPARSRKADILQTRIFNRLKDLVEVRPCFVVGQCCPECDGDGRMETTQLDVDRFEIETCPLCNGAGRMTLATMTEAMDNYRNVKTNERLGNHGGDPYPRTTRFMEVEIQKQLDGDFPAFIRAIATRHIPAEWLPSEKFQDDQQQLADALVVEDLPF